MENLFGMKELNRCQLKTTLDMKIDNREFKAGEVIAAFDRIQVATTNEVKIHVAATGGYDNRRLVNWDETKEVGFTFTQGVFSVTQFAMLSNSKLVSIEKGNNILIPLSEDYESDENGNFQTEMIPIEQEMFIYDRSTWEKITPVSIDENTITIPDAYREIHIDYYGEYSDGAKVVTLGQRLIPGYLRLEARTELVDDQTGKKQTGIVIIPKLKLMSDLSMRLGNTDLVAPFNANFSAVGIPEGAKGTKRVLEFIALDTNIDK